MSQPATTLPNNDGPYIGRPLPRFEDLRLVRGAGNFTDDIGVDRQAFAIFVRSPHAHADIIGIETADAAAQPGVVAILTGRDYIGDGLAGIAQVPNPADALNHKARAFAAADGKPILDEPQWPLATDHVRYVGEAVAVVIAETIYAAKDAAERVVVSYLPRPAVTDVLEAISDGAPLLWPAAPRNVAVDAAFGDKSAASQAISGAKLVLEQTLRNQRVATAQMEPRSAIGSYDRASGTYLLIAGSQSAHRQRQSLAQCLNVPESDVRVVVPDTGGGFGSRTNLNPELIVIVWAAKRLGRPVKWTSDRSEAFLTDYQGRDLVVRTKIGFDTQGRILGMTTELFGGVGGQTVSYVWLHNAYRISTSVYHVPVAFAHVCGVMTNTVPTAPFRGAGRPECILAIERLLDVAARRLGIDRVEIRRRNLIPHHKLPYVTPFGFRYDSGSFHRNMENALAIADWNGFEARRQASRRCGRLRGIGLANYVESPTGSPYEWLDIRVLAEGMVELRVGTQSTGQGHETSFRQVLADLLGIHPEQIRLITGDTAEVPSGGGSHSDRSMRFAATLMTETSARVLEAARSVAAFVLGAVPDDVTFQNGHFSARQSNISMTLFDAAAHIENTPDLPDDLRKPLAATASFMGRIPAYPTGAAICEVEIDPDTGAVSIERYASIDDAGQPINPLILHGQVHGGIAQGVGQALIEGMAYDSEGQVLTASFMDYGMPRAGLFPEFQVELCEDPTAGNPLRVKGGGESGITPAPAVVMNAISDALWSEGVEYVDMPATPARIWAALAGARKSLP